MNTPFSRADSGASPRRLSGPAPRVGRVRRPPRGSGGARPRLFGLGTLLLLAVALAAPDVGTNSGRGTSARPGGALRGQPIRPPAATVPGAEEPASGRPGVVTLPGGVVITNLPASVLPRSPTNTVRLPTWAARKFEPLGYAPTSFTVLARFFLTVPDAGSATRASSAGAWEEVRRQIPDDVRALNDRKVALAGFMLPLSLKQGRATEFLLLRSQSACCFGLVPRVNELVVVRMAAPGVVPRPDVPVIVGGTLRLKWIGEAGQLTSIYEMEGERFELAEGS